MLSGWLTHQSRKYKPQVCVLTESQQLCSYRCEGHEPGTRSQLEPMWPPLSASRAQPGAGVGATLRLHDSSGAHRWGRGVSHTPGRQLARLCGKGPLLSNPVTSQGRATGIRPIDC